MSGLSVYIDQVRTAKMILILGKGLGDDCTTYRYTVCKYFIIVYIKHYMYYFAQNALKHFYKANKSIISNKISAIYAIVFFMPSTKL